MHPAPSVIVFTTLSGLGFGLLFWLGIDPTPPTGMIAFGFFTIAYLLATIGLISSTMHLGHPERAIKAFSQWRSSWLSREAIAAVATLLTGALYGAGLVFFAAASSLLGWLVALGCLATVFTTAMIYTQLRTVPRWNTWTTPLIFLTLSLGGGALLANRPVWAIGLLGLSFLAQIFAWVSGDRRFAQSGTTLATATGLGGIGQIRSFAPPHTGSNYLLREFVHEVGRKHRQQLRALALGLGFLIPLTLAALGLTHITAAIAVLSHLAGVLCLRWLFFAEAEHVVGLYYGKR